MGCQVRVPSIQLAIALGLVFLPAAAQDENQDRTVLGAPQGTHRAAQDVGLNLEIDYDALPPQDGDPGSRAPVGSFRAAQDLPPRVDLSRRLGNSWELDPVLINRRQAGQPQLPDDDASDKLLGIELRRRF